MLRPSCMRGLTRPGHSRARRAMLALLIVVTGSCVGNVGELGGKMTPPKTSPPPDLPGASSVEVLAHPTTPTSEDGAAWGGSAAPELTGVLAVPNRDSAMLVLPVVEGAVDYRVFRLPAGARASEQNGGEQIDGTVIHCAGYRQHNDRFSGTRELMQLVEVTDLNDATDLVVEAIDAPCPFQGHLAPKHEDIQVTIDEVPVADRVLFSFFTADEIPRPLRQPRLQRARARRGVGAARLDHAAQSARAHLGEGAARRSRRAAHARLLRRLRRHQRAAHVSEQAQRAQPHVRAGPPLRKLEVGGVRLQRRVRQGAAV